MQNITNNRRLVLKKPCIFCVGEYAEHGHLINKGWHGMFFAIFIYTQYNAMKNDTTKYTTVQRSSIL